MKWSLVIKILIISLKITLLISNTNGAKILAVFGFPGPSQYIMASALLKGLVEREHEITLISTFPQEKPVKNFRDIVVIENSHLFDEQMRNAIGETEMPGFFEEMRRLINTTSLMVINIFENPQVKHMMKNEKFDLVIVETLMCEALYGMGQHFKAPMIGVSTFGTINFIDILVGNISPMSYIPHISLSYPNEMTLKERLINVITSIVDELQFNFVLLPNQKKLYEKYFPTSTLTFDEALRNFSLVLLNQHFSLSFPRPYVSNMIEVGGLHIKQQPDPLPKDMKEFLDNATEGVIYFSMGSNLKSKDFPPETINAFLDAFRELKLKVLWKFEAESLPNKPDNVFIKAWYPQPSVLAHSNVKLFISHGGLLSTTESIFFAKPILGIPVFGDQPMNVRIAVQSGYALQLQLNRITKESFKSAIQELVMNDRYTKRVQQLSRYYRDQPQPPLEKAIYWVEYVLRHNGAIHMRNAGMNLNYFQRNNIDVFAILIFGIIFNVTTLGILLRFIVKLLRSDKKSNTTKIKSN